MLKPGQMLRTEKGLDVTIDAFLANGSQGDVYRAHGADRTPLVLKSFRKPDTDLAQRTAFLVRNLADMGPAVLCPADRVLLPGFLATVAPFVPGMALDAWMQESPRAGDLKTRLIMALGVAAAVESFQKRGWTPGDLGADQFIVRETASLATVHLVDLDSLVAPGLPAPGTLGKLAYFSPELRKAFLADQSHPITAQSDIFSLGVLLHELLLMRHPAVGYADPADPEGYHRTMMAGWPGDPLAGGKAAAGPAIGFPVALLDPNTQRILRFALNPNPGVRPTAAAIKHDLAAGLLRMSVCPACQWGIIPHEGQSHCPYPECGALYGLPRLQGGGHSLVLDQPRMLLGRNDFPDPHISRQHLQVRRMGPCLEVVSLGMNGTFLLKGGQWLPFPAGRPVMLAQGDVIRVGRVHLCLVA